MPRRARMYLPGLPYHLVHRGNNRRACFFDVEDRECYLELLSNSLATYGVALHAYVLMTNHVHLLVTPEEMDSISRMTRVAGSSYARYINRKYSRTGSLWEGRHKSSPVDSEAYLLKCYRYIEMNPVRAKLVSRPGDYPWSSYAANALGRHSTLLSSHASYRGLGSSKQARCNAYSAIVDQALDEPSVAAIRHALHYCCPLGDERFVQIVEAQACKA